MKTIRIGAGSGGCTYERIEPAVEMVQKGSVDYLVFECLSERTVAEAQLEKMEDPSKGYNPMLQERMEVFLPLMGKYGFKIVSNMGAANTPAACAEVLRIARELDIDIKVAMVSGDDIIDTIRTYDSLPVGRTASRLADIDGIVSANVYLGSDGIRRALDEGADVVITGRVADAALFVGPIVHEFGWECKDAAKMGQAILVGHMMECCAQLTGGYFADPGVKDVPGMDRLGHPIAEVSEDGRVVFTKAAGSGGLVSVDTCKEQMLYEVGDPACYITPDGVADFSHVTFTPDGADRVVACGAAAAPPTDTYKVNVGYLGGCIGIGEVSFGGSSALKRAELAAKAVQGRWEIIGIEPLERHVSYIGYDSLYGDSISSRMRAGAYPEVRLRIAVRTATESDARRLIREVQCLYINGPAGSAGISASFAPCIALAPILVPRKDIGAGNVTIERSLP